MTGKNGFIRAKISALLLLLLNFVTPSMGQKNDNISEQKDKVVSVVSLSGDEKDSNSDYYMKLAHSRAGLDKKTMRVVDEDKKQDYILLASDNGIIIFVGKWSNAAVVKKGKIYYIASNDASKEKFVALTNSDEINILRMLTEEIAEPGTLLYSAMRVGLCSGKSRIKRGTQKVY